MQLREHMTPQTRRRKTLFKYSSAKQLEKVQDEQRLCRILENDIVGTTRALQFEYDEEENKRN